VQKFDLARGGRLLLLVGGTGRRIFYAQAMPR
jgi:hypothetical protein